MRQFTSREFIKIVKVNGFYYDRHNGDHAIYVNNEGRHISIPRNLESVIALRLIKENNLITDIKKKKMTESGYYPPGAEHDPNAPWNQSDLDPVDVDCYVSCSISKDATVSTTDYIAKEWEDWDMDDDEEGYIPSSGVYYDFSDCNFSEAYHQDHYGILELLEQLKVFLEGAIKDLEQPSPEASKEEQTTKRANLRIYKQMLEDCQGWTLDEEEVGEA